jgi:Type II intron maturase
VAKNPWTVLNPEEIITRYNYIIRGLANYYLPVVDRLTYFQYMIYILKFSCLSTFAKKYKSKITKITKKYGDPLTINVRENIYYKKLETQKEVEKTFKLLTYLEIKQKVGFKKYNWKKKKNISIPEENIFKPMATINWRTYKNLDNICCICGTDRNVEQHHIHHVRKGKVVGFSQVMKQLNRKTIPLCHTHHQEVHNHKYNDIALSELIGIERFLT